MARWSRPWVRFVSGRGGWGEQTRGGTSSHGCLWTPRENLHESRTPVFVQSNWSQQKRLHLPSDTEHELKHIRPLTTARPTRPSTTIGTHRAPLIALVRSGVQGVRGEASGDVGGVRRRCRGGASGCLGWTPVALLGLFGDRTTTGRDEECFSKSEDSSRSSLLWGLLGLSGLGGRD